MEHDPTPARPPASLSRGKAIAYSVVLAAGVVAAIWTGVQYINSRKCDLCAKKRALPEAAVLRRLVEDFTTPVLLYKGDKTGIEAIRPHAVALRARGYDIVSVSQITGALSDQGRLPERCVAFAVEAGGKLPVAETQALVATAGVPLAVFVDPARIGDATFTWDDLMQLQARGAEFHCLAATSPGNTERLRAALRAFRDKTHRRDLHLMAASPQSVTSVMKLAASVGIRVVWHAESSAVRAEKFRKKFRQTDRAALSLPCVPVADRTDEDEIVERVAVLTAPLRDRDVAQSHARQSGRGNAPRTNTTDGGNAE
ncbi:MAG: hypothetical protein GX446_10035 [Chthonomonadales bacterium]|nr:hypothetical protein [Chthonomonadales bacterium]